MSVYGQRRNQVVEGVSHHGLYDLANQIVVIPSEGTAPEVVIDHEVTHVNLINNTSLGRLELACNALKRTAMAVDARDALDLINRQCSRPLQQACELTHEAAAWFGTSILSRRPLPEVPPRYSRLVDRLRRLFDGTGIPTFRQGPDAPSQMDIVEDAAQLALNSPAAGQIVRDPDAAWARSLTPYLTRSAVDQPLWRFRSIVAWLERCSPEEMTCWSASRDPESASSTGDADAPAPTFRRAPTRRRQPLPEVRYSDLTDEQVTELVRSAVTASGLDRYPPFDDPRFSWDDWSTFHLLDRFLPGIDRYAQTCVVEPSLSPSEVVRGGPPPAAAATTPTMVVGIVPPIGYQQPSVATLPEGWGHVILPGEPEGRQAWLAPAGGLRRVLLQARDRGAAVVAASNGYRYGIADYPSCAVLDGVPHAVMAVLDFRALWTHLAMVEGGLAGSCLLEWSALPAPRLGRPYGYLLVKPADRSHPVVILPTAGPPHRVVSAADDLPSPHGVTLVPTREPHHTWLGPLARHVTAAISVFERWPSAPSP